MTIGATRPIPTLRASKPKETPNGKTAIAIGTARRAPSRSRVVMALHHRHLPLGGDGGVGEGGVAPRQRGGGALRPDPLGLEPLLGLREKDAHLGEERSRRRSSSLELVDALEPRQYGAGLVHATDGSREKRSCWCRIRAERGGVSRRLPGLRRQRHRPGAPAADGGRAAPRRDPRRRPPGPRGG